MITDITKHMNCIQHCIYNICKKYGLAEFLIFCNGWSFFYDAAKDFNQSLNIPTEETSNYFLREYQGLQCEKITVNKYSPEDVTKLVFKNITNNRDVVVEMNSFYCTWHKGYNKICVPHFFQIVDVDICKSKAICMDSYFSKYKEEVSIEEILAGCDVIRFFYCDEAKKRINPQSIVEQIKKTVNINQITDSMSLFAGKLLDIDNTSELFDNDENIFFCNNTRYLRFISDSRFCMSYLFDKLGEFEDETLYYDISKKFFECGLAYEKINSYYMKLYYKKTNIKQNLRILSNKILEIQKNEILIYDML